MRTGDDRRRDGSILVLVMAILSILFVTGVTFLTTMNFEAKVIEAEKRLQDQNAGVDMVSQISTTILADTLEGGLGEAIDSTKLGTFQDGVLKLGRGAWAELPVVHGMIASAEPFKFMDPSNNERYGYSYITDLKTLQSGIIDLDTVGPNDPSDPSSYGRAWVPASGNDLFIVNPADEWDGALVDADGDGMYDSRQYLLTSDTLSAAQLAKLSRTVNSPENAGEGVYLGLRIVAHGGMANLNDSHPNIIDAVMDYSAGSFPMWETNESDIRNGPYTPAAEESSLRRRGSLLPSRDLEITALQGNPIDPADFPAAGGGDFGAKLFMSNSGMFGGADETVRTGEHRYWPYDRNDDFGMNDWQVRMRMEPDLSNIDDYDRRHVSTTVSHDDNLMRSVFLEDPDGVRVYNVLDLMIDAVLANNGCDASRFELVNYPHTVASAYDADGNPIDWCACETDPDCVHNLRKGRLRLSLPWLEKEFDDTTEQQRNDLIQETFFMLLLNARGSEWGEFQNEPPVGTPVSRTWQRDATAYANISRTAASLTANMIDFMDDDEDPTRIEVRWFNFTDEERYPPNPATCVTPGDWLANVGQSTCDLAADSAVDVNCIPIQCEAVYGLERQPFITEVAAKMIEQPPGNFSSESTFAVELFNPYDEAINLTQFSLRVGLTGMDIRIDKDIPAKGYLVVIRESAMPPLDLANAIRVDETNGFLDFRKGNEILLVRDNPDGSSNPIVVDSYKVPPKVADESVTDIVWSSGRKSVGRFISNGLSPWFAPIPAHVDDQFADHRLGTDNDITLPDLALQPVEVLFSDRGTLSTAFPSTGSMHFLMRHANRSVSDSVTGGKRAFTEFLRDTTTPIHQDIDNGRMPVFDLDNRQHIDPNADDPLTPATEWDRFRPGELMHLPWGQLIYDYFTAIPLTNDGPYRATGSTLVDQDAQPRVDLDGLRVHGRININAAPWIVMSGLPYMPMDNYAPELAAILKESLALKDVADNTVSDDQSSVLGAARAKALVAYRDAREITESPTGPTTGDYDSDSSSMTVRGWAEPSPTFRRGTGFMSVGEMANARHGSATNDTYRMDAGNVGVVDPTVSEPSYLRAIAPLACLGDWMAVRSHVFTVYGSVRGVGAQFPDTSDVDERALRFQKTIDRLPTMLGEAKPARIGSRTVAKYSDVLND